jgi:hypothetical protein
MRPHPFARLAVRKADLRTPRVRANQRNGAALTAGELHFTALCREPRRNTLAVIALDFDDAVLSRAAGSTVTFELLGDDLELARIEAGNDAHRSGPPPFAQDANDAVVRYAPRSRHAARFGRRA